MLLETQLLIAGDIGLLRNESLNKLTAELNRITLKTSKLISTLKQYSL